MLHLAPPSSETCRKASARIRWTASWPTAAVSPLAAAASCKASTAVRRSNSPACHSVAREWQRRRKTSTGSARTSSSATSGLRTGAFMARRLAGRGRHHLVNRGRGDYCLVVRLPQTKTHLPSPVSLARGSCFSSRRLRLLLAPRFVSAVTGSRRERAANVACCDGGRLWYFLWYR